MRNERPIIIVDSQEMAHRLRELNADVDVQVVDMVIPARERREWFRLTDDYQGPISNRHERRKSAALARRR